MLIFSWIRSVLASRQTPQNGVCSNECGAFTGAAARLGTAGNKFSNWILTWMFIIPALLQSARRRGRGAAVVQHSGCWCHPVTAEWRWQSSLYSSISPISLIFVLELMRPDALAGALQQTHIGIFAILLCQIHKEMTFAK